MDSARASVVQESVVCADSRAGCVYTFPRGAATTPHLTVTCCATGAAATVALKPPLTFRVTRAELNCAGTLLLVVGGPARTALACIDVSACHAGTAAPPTARTFALGAECMRRARLAAGPVHAWAQHRLLSFAHGAGATVLCAHWYPHSAQHVLVLTRDARLHLFDVLRDPAAPARSWVLAPAPAPAPRLFPPVSFACTRGPTASWASAALHFVHADGALSVFGPVLPKSGEDDGDVSVPEEEEDCDCESGDFVEREPQAVLLCVAQGEGSVHTDTAFDVAVAATAPTAPCVVVRSNGRDRIDCFAACNERDAYVLVDRITLPSVRPAPTLLTRATPNTVLVQDAARAGDIIVLRPGRVDLLHIDYRIRTASASACVPPPPALLVPLFVSRDTPPPPFAGAAFVVGPGAAPRVAVLDAAAGQLRWCTVPPRSTLNFLAAVPLTCRAQAVTALCPLPDSGDDEVAAARAAAVLRALIEQLQRTASDLGARTRESAAAVDEVRTNVPALERSQDDNSAAVAHARTQQDTLRARVDALLASPCVAEHSAVSAEQCRAMLAVIEKQISAREDVLSKVCNSLF